MLARLMAHRGLGTAALVRAADVDEADLRAVLDGAEPSPALVGRLAPVLGLHTADLHVVLWTDVPEELAPLDPEAGVRVRYLVRDAARLSAPRIADALAVVRSLPQQPRPEPFAPYGPWAREHPEPTLGGVLVRMLHNRNLRWTDMAPIMAFLTPTYLSIATYPSIGNGRSELTPDRVADFAAVLGIPPACMAALMDMELPDRTPQHHPATGEFAELIWEMRRLTKEQVAQV